jgi:hypothetical protein
MAPTLEQAIEVTSRKAFVILDGTLLRIDRVGMASGYDHGFYSGKHKAHGLNVQVIADPIGRLVWISPPLPGARHDMGAAREHGIIDAIAAHEIPAVADTAYQGAGPTVEVPQRRRRMDPDTGRCRTLSAFQKDVNTAHARQHGPGERVNAELKNWRILRKIRSSRTPPTSSSPHFRPHDHQRMIRLAKPYRALLRSRCRTGFSPEPAPARRGRKCRSALTVEVRSRQRREREGRPGR